MGFEYKIRLLQVDREDLDDWLRNHEFFARFVDEFHYYEFRRADNADVTNMPNLDVRIENDGLYVNNLDSNYMMYDLVHTLLAKYGSVQIDEL